MLKRTNEIVRREVVMAKTKHDWAALDRRIDSRKAQGWNATQIAKELGIGRQTLVDHLRSRELVHPSISETAEIIEVPQETLEHPGTLAGYPEVLQEIQETLPEVAPLIIDEVHLSTPEVHPEVSVADSTSVHSGVPVRQERSGNQLAGHPGTPTAEDWELWSVIKARWLEVEKLLTDRQSLVGTLSGTPGNTRKKTYVFDERHIALIDQFAKEHRCDLKDVMSQALEEFFQRRGYIGE
jgi:hypothetical protein